MQGALGPSRHDRMESGMRVRPDTANAVINISYKFGYHPSLDDIRVLESRIRDLEEEIADRNWKDNP